MHFNLRKDFLSRIYLKDAKNAAQREWVDEMIYVSELNDAYLTLRCFKRLSTTFANTAQFSEYLNLIDKYFTSNGVQLPKPEDEYMQAMGRRR